jgi:hypothetical protein
MEQQTTELIFPEWRDENSHRNYPFADEATLTSDKGNVLPNNMFLDGRLYPIGADPELYLSSIDIYGNIVTVAIGDSKQLVVAQATFDYLTPPELLEFTDQYGRPAGVLVSTPEQLRLLPALFTGTVAFSFEQTAFAASAIIPQPQPGVRGILLDDGAFFSEDVYLIGVKGIVLTQTDPRTIRVDIMGDPYAKQKVCKIEGIAVPPFCGLKTINYIHPDPKTGDFKLSPGANPPYAHDNVLRVHMEDGVLVVENMGSVGTKKA